MLLPPLDLEVLAIFLPTLGYVQSIPSLIILSLFHSTLNLLNLKKQKKCTLGFPKSLQFDSLKSFEIYR